ncbi:MAG: cytochrome c oxidase subunit 3 [Acidobacteriota bacterium]
MVEVTSREAVEARWSGGVLPLGISWAKLMMWIFIITDGLLFAGFLASYGFARTASSVWPDTQQVFHLWFISLMTFVLISSSATMATGVAAARRRDAAMVTRMVLATAAGGVCFLGMQAIEWTTLIREGARLHGNPWGVPQFANYFFLITGLHGTHVLIGVIVLAIVAARSLRRRATAEGVEVAGLYWHFVDLVWVFIFTLFYLV